MNDFWKLLKFEFSICKSWFALFVLSGLFLLYGFSISRSGKPDFGAVFTQIELPMFFFGYLVTPGSWRGLDKIRHMLPVPYWKSGLAQILCAGTMLFGSGTIIVLAAGWTGKSCFPYLFFLFCQLPFIWGLVPRSNDGKTKNIGQYLLLTIIFFGLGSSIGPLVKPAFFEQISFVLFGLLMPGNYFLLLRRVTSGRRAGWDLATVQLLLCVMAWSIALLPDVHHWLIIQF